MLGLHTLRVLALPTAIVLACSSEPAAPIPARAPLQAFGQGQSEGEGFSSAESGPITIAIAGDVMLGRLVNENIPRRGYAYPWGDVLPILRGADLFLINQEFTLTTETRPAEYDPVHKPFNFRAEPAVVQTLVEAGVDFVSVANNHIKDFGDKGLVQTLQALDEAGIAHAGAGLDRESAARPAILTARGVRIAVVSYADYPSSWAAGPDSPGLNHAEVSVAAKDMAGIEDSLSEALREADFVIFSIHWGPNFRPRPPDSFRRFARSVVTAGADVFWGHSAHLVQGVEVYNGRLILYDTGDFVDDYAVDRKLRNDLSALFLVKVAPPEIASVELLPVHIDDMQVNVAKGPEREWIVQRIKSLSEEFGTEVVTDTGGVNIPVAPQ